MRKYIQCREPKTGQEKVQFFCEDEINCGSGPGYSLSMRYRYTVRQCCGVSPFLTGTGLFSRFRLRKKETSTYSISMYTFFLTTPYLPAVISSLTLPHWKEYIFANIYLIFCVRYRTVYKIMLIPGIFADNLFFLFPPTPEFQSGFGQKVPAPDKKFRLRPAPPKFSSSPRQHTLVWGGFIGLACTSIILRAT